MGGTGENIITWQNIKCACAAAEHVRNDTTATQHCTVTQQHPQVHTEPQNSKVISKSDFPEDSWQSVKEKGGGFNNSKGGFYLRHLGYFVSWETWKLGCGACWPSNGIQNLRKRKRAFTLLFFFFFLCSPQRLTVMALHGYSDSEDDNKQKTCFCRCGFKFKVLLGKVRSLSSFLGHCVR